jgi:hypothetical protein
VKTPTYLYRRAADGTIAAELFDADVGLPTEIEGYFDNPEKVPAVVVEAAAPPAPVEPDQFDAMDREQLVAAYEAATDKKAPGNIGDETLRKKLRELTAAAPPAPVA